MAQTRGVGYGVMGGINFGDFETGEVTSGKARTGLQLGGFAVFPVGRHVAIQPAVFYSQEGARFGSVSFTRTLKLDYIEIPLLLKLSPSLEGSPLHPYVAAGPAVGFQVSCSTRLKVVGPSVETACTRSASGLDTKRVQVGMHFGVGLEFGRLALGFSYLRDVTSIEDISADVHLKNRVVAIVAGYRIGSFR